MIAKQIKIPALDLQTAWMIVTLLAMLPALYVELTGDFPGRALFYGMEEDSWLAGVLLNAHDSIFVILANVMDVLGNVWNGVRNFIA